MAPVSIRDVQIATGCGDNDLGTLVMNANINMWARFKPVRYPSVGLITDAAIAIPAANELALKLSLAPDQLGMKIGMLVGMLFPLVGIPLYFSLWKSKRTNKA